MAIHLKRVYDPPAPADGHRVLVDRVWPRGLTKEAACLDEWLEDLAPSSTLRAWFGHDPGRWDEFRARYTLELEEPERQAQLERLRRLAADQRVCLLFGARDREHNQAVVLGELLRRPDLRSSRLDRS